MEPWLEHCRAAVADVEAVLVARPSRDERERPVGEGMATSTASTSATAARQSTSHGSNKPGGAGGRR